MDTGRKNRFHAATKSIRHRSRRTGVTVVWLENHSLPLLNLLQPPVRQNKIDGRRHRLAGPLFQQLVRQAVRAWRVRTHPEAVRNRLELFLFFVNAAAAPPKPRLVHERPVRRIHQSDDSVIDVSGQIAGQMRDLVFRAEGCQLRRRRHAFRHARAGRSHIDPDVAVALFTRVMSRKNAIDFQFVLARQRWNFRALPAASLEAPSVIAAFQRLPIEVAVRQRNPAMRTRITHRKRLAVRGAAQNQRHLQQHRCR